MAIEDVVINATAQQIEDMATRQISQEITEDSSAEELASAKAVYDVVKNAGTGGGGLEPLIVEIEHEVVIVSHTAQDILKAYEEGREVRGKLYTLVEDSKDVLETWLTLASVDESSAVFVYYYSNTDWEWYRITENYEFTYGTSRSYVKQTELGDLDTALANILEYAQNLVGGGES